MPFLSRRRRPNPRLQRTSLGAPLSRKPLGDTLKSQGRLARGTASVPIVLFGVLAGFLSTSCVSVTPAGAAVRITNNPDVVRGCKSLGNFSLSTVTKTPSQGESLFRNKVAADGGNVGYIIHIEGNGSVMFPLEYSGEEYLCPAAETR
jgi:hypothetical protein